MVGLKFLSILAINLKMIDALDDLDDVVNVHTNADITAE